jgi:hypothetical protein
MQGRRLQPQAMTIRALGLLVTVISVSAAALGSASAQPRPPIDFHDARYCEIFELRGALPDVRVKVWNTIGLNRCPAAKWEALDPVSLAAELGAQAVILNGPRHFLMDSGSGKTGRVRSIGGLRVRKVATIPITSAADLDRTPYTERTIGRTTTWRWDRGRRVYELLAPDGSNYVMQSYAQIIDPELTIGKLRRLGDRLELPKGWRYRTRRLNRDLKLRAKGKATIIQDDLQNTYQRLPRKRGAPPPKRHRVDVIGMTKTVGSPTPGTVVDRGTITGPPFGSGSLDLEVIFGASSVTGTFEIVSRRGSAFGTVAMDYTISGSEITFRGTAEFTGGTKKFRGIKGHDLKAYDHNMLDGQSGSVKLRGFARY